MSTSSADRQECLSYVMIHELAPTTSVTSLAAPSRWLLIPRALAPVFLGLAIALILQFIVTPRIGGFYADMLINSGIAIILAVSLTVVNGFTGQFSIGHAGFMSLGGYAAVALVYYGSIRLFGSADFLGGKLSYTGSDVFVGPWLARGDALFLGSLFVGAVFAGIVGWFVGLPALRLRGDYLAIVTLGFGEIVRVVIQGTPEQLDVTSTDPSISDLSFPKLLTHLGGALGFSGAPGYTTVFWVWVAVAITLGATIRLKNSSYGRALLSIREDEIAARATGVNTTKYKVRAFVFSSFFAGLAGGLYALKIGTINAGELGFQRSFDFIIMVVLGGLGSVSGAALAAIILTALPELLRNPPSILPHFANTDKSNLRWQDLLPVPSSLWGVGIVGFIAICILLMAPRKRGPMFTLIGLCIVWEGGRYVANKAGVNLADYRMIIYSLALILMMILRPAGLFGVREIWDYLPLSWQIWRRGRV